MKAPLLKRPTGAQIRFSLFLLQVSTYQGEVNTQIGQNIPGSVSQMVNIPSEAHEVPSINSLTGTTRLIGEQFL